MNTQETREAMIEIDAQPMTNPLDVPTPKPSEIVRNWPDAMWGIGFSKTVIPDGHTTFCAIGILGEVAGFSWGDPYAETSHWKRWAGESRSPVALFVGGLLGLNLDEMEDLISTNDRQGKEAAADLLESWGL